MEVEAVARIVTQLFERLVTEGKGIPPESLVSVMNLTDPDHIADTIIPYLNLRVDQKQELLEAVNIRERLDKLVTVLNREQEILDVQRNIRTRVGKRNGRQSARIYPA